MLIQFNDLLDKAKVLKDNPKNFDKCLILLQEYDGRKQVHKLTIVEVYFQVLVHDLPLMAHNVFMGNMIDNSLGKVKEVDLEAGDVEWGEQMRVRVTVDITKPLPQKKKLSIGDMEPVWLSLTYEWLLNFCFAMGHWAWTP